MPVEYVEYVKHKQDKIMLVSVQWYICPFSQDTRPEYGHRKCPHNSRLSTIVIVVKNVWKNSVHSFLSIFINCSPTKSGEFEFQAVNQTF